VEQAVDENVDGSLHIPSTGCGQDSQCLGGRLTVDANARQHSGNECFAQHGAVLKVITTEFSNKDLEIKE
jgi:hypothetical protein